MILGRKKYLYTVFNLGDPSIFLQSTFLSSLNFLLLGGLSSFSYYP